VGAKDIFELRKAGKLDEALRAARTEHARDPKDTWILRAYGWVLYDYVKKATDAFEAKQLSASGLSHRITPYMKEFSSFGDLLRRDTCFSQMVRLAVKASGAWDDFLIFAHWAGTEDLDPEGNRPFVNEDGKTLDSLQTRLKRAICKLTVAMAGAPDKNPELVSWGQSILAEALNETPNDQWLNFYSSKLHLLRGDVEAASKRLYPVLRRQSRAPWPWSLLGLILEGSRPQDALTCLAHASQLAREEQEVAKVRPRLAHLLVQASRFDEAAYEVKQALAYRELHGFKVPTDLAALAASDWYRRAVETGSLRRVPKAAASAQDLLDALDERELTYTRGVIDHVNAERRLSYVATSAADGFALLHQAFPTIAELPPGTQIDVGCAEAGGRPQKWRPAPQGSLPGLYEAAWGWLERVPEKDFAFIRTNGDDVFVPPQLAKDFAPGTVHEVRCWAIRRANKTGKVSWRAIRFAPLELQDDSKDISKSVVKPSDCR
jgi:tetratricopeptide (TPR) repeat protein